jgi:hypothetical protein
MPAVRFIPDEFGEATLRRLTREPDERRIPNLWAMSGSLELEVGLTEPLRLNCASPLQHGLEPLLEMAQFSTSGRSSPLSKVLGTAWPGRSSHLYYRWRGEHDAVVQLGLRDSTLGISREDDLVRITVLETDDQPELEDTTCTLSRLEVGALPLQLWQDLDALLRLMGIELEEREAAKWQRLGSDLEVVVGSG